jgi:hypothetical protein
MGMLIAVITPSLLKRLGAVLLLLGLVLPLYSCRGRFLDATGREVKYVDQRGAAVPEGSLDLRQPLPPGVSRLEPDTKPPAGLHFRKNYHYFLGDFSADDWTDWLRLGGFLWPMAAAFLVDGSRRRWGRLLFLILEPFLVWLSAFSLAASALFGTKEIGFWTAWPGIVSYGLGAAWSDITDLRAWKPGMGTLRRSLLVVLVFGAFLAGSVVTVLAFFDWFLE